MTKDAKGEAMKQRKKIPILMYWGLNGYFSILAPN